MIKTLVSIDVATADVERFLDARFVPDVSRKDNEISVNKLIAAVQYGQLMVSNSGSLTQKLNFPILASDNSVVLGELKYKMRLTMNEVEQCLKSDAPANRMYGSFLTEQNSEMIGKMDTSDLTILSHIVVFFTT